MKAEKRRLNNGVEIPAVGLGVFKMNAEDTQRIVRDALLGGIRLIDTAVSYRNEEAVGRGIQESGVAREDIFLTSKLWNNSHGYENTLRSFEESLERLKTDYLDMYLIHFPVPSQDKYVETYRALEYLYEKKKIRAIGVSNFHAAHLKRILEECKIPPMLDQFECHPYLVQTELIEFCREYGILPQAWSPLAKGMTLKDPVIKEIAEKYRKTEAQIILRWEYQRGVLVIPKSASSERVISNSDIFSFELEEDEMNRITGLDRGERTGPDPDVFDRMTF